MHHRGVEYETLFDGVRQSSFQVMSMASRLLWHPVRPSYSVVTVILLICLTPAFCGVANASPGMRGMINRIYTDGKGKQHKYVMFVPFTWTHSIQSPLLVFLNGHGDDGDDGITAMRGPLGEQMWDAKGRFPFVTIFPQCHVGSDWTVAETRDRALAIMEEVAQEYNTDPDRVYLTGVSSGASGVWEFAAADPSRFAAIAPLCGVPNIEKIVRALSDVELPIWIFCNRIDKSVYVDANRMVYEELLKAGLNSRYTEPIGVPGTEHDVWSFAYRNAALYEWMLRQSRSANLAKRAKFNYLLHSFSLEEWTQRPEHRWKLSSNRIVTVDDSADASYLITNQEYRDFELHLDFQLGSAQSFVLWLKPRFSDSTVDGLKLVITDAHLGSGGLQETAGRGWLIASDPFAERSLLHGAEWNDLRVKSCDQKIVAELNGYQLLAFQDASLAWHDAPIALESMEGAKSVKLRHIQCRELLEKRSGE